VVVCYLYVEGFAPGPSEADSPLLIDPNAVLTCPVSFQALQPISRWHSQVIYAFSCIQQEQLPVCAALHVWWQQARTLPPEDLLHLSIGEAPNHGCDHIG